jgi:hypothetical protein
MQRAIRFIATAVVVAQLSMGALPQQMQTPSASTRPFDPMAVMRSRGEVVAKGLNDVPTGKLGVKSYRLERTHLNDPYVFANGTKVEYAYKLIVTGGPFLPGGYLIWVDDQPFPALANTARTELTAVFLNLSNSLEDGATLLVTDVGNPCSIDKGSQVVLPEKLSVPPDLRAVPLDSSRIRLRTTTPSKQTEGKPEVTVTITTTRLIPTGNGTPAIQIGKHSFPAGGWNYEASAVVPSDVFSTIPDNSQVTFKWGLCAAGGEIVGRLNKSMLDR